MWEDPTVGQRVDLSSDRKFLDGGNMGNLDKNGNARHEREKAFL